MTSEVSIVITVNIIASWNVVQYCLVNR